MLAVTLICACGPGPSPKPTGTIDTFPEPESFAANEALPDVFTSFSSSARVTTPEDLRGWRRRELQQLFAHYVYGRAPEAIRPAVIAEQPVVTVLAGAAQLRQVELDLGGVRVFVALFLPSGVARPPVVLALNKCGNQTLLDDGALRATTSPVIAPCVPDRGSTSSQWPLLELMQNGIALATVHESDGAVDSASARPAFAVLKPGGAMDTQWGTIAQWSFLLSRVADHLGTRDDVDASRLAVFGHSRRGKAALWAAANDERFSHVWAHQSGTLGAALTRSLVGESIADITLFFPHWFDDVLTKFAGKETSMPVDQHQLLALVAPRALLVTDGEADTHADPPGAKASVEAATPAWTLLGASEVPTWQSRPGVHEVTRDDWLRFITWVKTRGF